VSSTLNGGVIYVAVCVISALVGGWIGLRKGSSFFVWFVISGVVPVLGPIVALCYRRETEESLRVCPACGAAVKLYDSICMSCGTDLSYPDDAEIIEPTSALRVRARL
jgi:ribosomal protein L32